jgi:hypothetical protein
MMRLLVGGQGAWKPSMPPYNPGSETPQLLQYQLSSLTFRCCIVHVSFNPYCSYEDKVRRASKVVRLLAEAWNWASLPHYPYSQQSLLAFLAPNYAEVSIYPRTHQSSTLFYLPFYGKKIYPFLWRGMLARSSPSGWKVHRAEDLLSPYCTVPQKEHADFW